MTDPNVLTSIPAVLVLGLVLRGLWPFWTRRAAVSEELFHFTRGLGWIIGTFMARTLYWGTVRGAVIAIDPGAWAAWSAWVAGPNWINAVFNIGLCVGGWFVLRAFYAMIPAGERHGWSVLSAPFYPDGWCGRRLLSWYVRIWPRRED